MKKKYGVNLIPLFNISFISLYSEEDSEDELDDDESDEELESKEFSVDSVFES